MAPIDAGERAIPSGVVRFLALAALGVVVLVGGLLWDVVGHDRNPDLAHQGGVLTVANPAHVVFLAGLAAVVVGVGGASLSAFATAAGPGQHQLKWVGVVAVVILVAASAGLLVVSSGAGAGAGDGAGAGHAAAAARDKEPAAPAPVPPAAHHDQKPAAHPQHGEAGCCASPPRPSRWWASSPLTAPAPPGASLTSRRT